MIHKKPLVSIILLSLFVVIQSCYNGSSYGKTDINLILFNKSKPFTDSLSIVLKEFEEDENCIVRIHNLIGNNSSNIIDFIAGNPDSADVIEINSWNIELLACSGLLGGITDSVLSNNPMNKSASFNNLQAGIPWMLLRDKLCINTELIDTLHSKFSDGMIWGDFITALSNSITKPGIRPLALNILDRYGFWSFFLYYGEIHSPGFVDSVESFCLGEDVAVDVFNSMDAFIKYSWIGSSEEAYNLFARGKSAAIIANESEVFDIMSRNPKIRIRQYELPVSNTGQKVNLIDAVSLGINKKSGEKEKSLKLAGFLRSNTAKFGFNNTSSEGKPLFAGNSALLADFYGKALYSYLFDKYYYRTHFSGMKTKLEELLRTSKAY